MKMPLSPGVVLAIGLLGFAPALNAQQPLDRTTSGVGYHRLSITAGVGNSFGWFGTQAEKYFQEGRLSALGAVGYTPRQGNHAYGATFAFGARGFTAGTSHRGFVELTFSQVVRRLRWRGVVGEQERASIIVDADRIYGPGVQAGYQFTAGSGFTIVASAGLGYAGEIGSPLIPLIGLGLGHAWR